MELKCINCSSLSRVQYDGTIQKGGVCMHNAFFKSGFIRINRENPEEFDVITHAGKDRMAPEVIEKNFKEGFLYQDMIQQRNPFQRSCDHWSSGLRLLPTILLSEDLEALREYEPELVARVKAGEERTPGMIQSFIEQKYPWIVDQIKDFVKVGMPLEEKPLERYSRSSVSHHTLHEVPKENLEYNPCASCHFYEPSLDEKGRILPHRGQCTQQNIKAGVFNVSTGTRKPTYSFFGCSKWLFPKEHKGIKPAPLNNRLLPFVETNPFDMSLTMLRHIASFPNTNILPVFTEEHFDDLKSRDLFGEAKEKHNSTNFAKMYAGMKNVNVLIFFTKGLKRTHKEKNDYWAQFKGYREVEEDLYGDVFTTPIPGVKSFNPEDQEESEDDN